MITSLSLENFKSHSRSSFSFSRGTNILLGRMGSGKSSVLDALCLALYGTFPRMSRRDSTTESVVAMGSGAEYASVEVEFEKGGETFRVSRKIGKKTSEAEVRKGGALAQKGPKAVTEYVSAVLGVDYELFTRAIYSEQNRMDYLLSLNPRARKQEIDWLLGLGRFDTAREAAQSAHGKLSEQAELLSSEANAQRLSAAKAKAAELGAQAEERRKRHALLKEGLSATADELRKKELALSILEKQGREWRAAQSECERHKGALERSKRETEGKERPTKEKIGCLIQKRDEHARSLAKARNDAKKQQAALLAASSEIAVLQSAQKDAQARQKRRAEIEEKIRALLMNASHEEILGEQRSLRLRLEKISGERAGLHAECGELQKALASLFEGRAKCPVCDSDLSGGRADALRREKQGQLEVKTHQGEKLAEDAAALREAIDSIDKRISDLALHFSEMERISREGEHDGNIGARLEAKAAEGAALEAAVKKSDDALSALELELLQARAAAEEAERAYHSFEEMDAAAERLAAARKKAEVILFDETAHEAARKEAEALRVERARRETEASSEEKQLALILQMLALENAALSEMTRKARLANDYFEAAKSMAIYKNSLSAAQLELRTMLVAEINDALCEIWSAIYPYSDYGGVKLEADEKDYRLLMEKNGSFFEVDSVASGGERACLCLALRIAFATVLTPDIGWLILDEPTHNLDSDAVALLSEAIGKKIPSIVAQTFVITHDAALGNPSEGRVFLLERDKAGNGATRVNTG